MSEKKVLVNLFKPVTFKGMDYGVGQQSLPKELADNVVRKNLGSLEETAEEVTTIPEDFVALSIEEMMKRYAEGDSWEIVFQSFRFNQPLIAEQRRNDKAEAEKRREEAEKQRVEAELSAQNKQNSQTEKTEVENEKETEKETEKEVKEPAVADIPADFPQRHIFVKLGFNSVAEIQAKTKEELVALEGIADASAEKALAYGK